MINLNTKPFIEIQNGRGGHFEYISGYWLAYNAAQNRDLRVIEHKKFIFDVSLMIWTIFYPVSRFKMAAAAILNIIFTGLAHNVG